MHRMLAFDGLLQEIEDKIRRLEWERKRLVNLENSFYNSDAVIIIADGEGSIQLLSRGAERFTGYDADEIKGKHISSIIEGGHDGDECGNREIRISCRGGIIRPVRAFVSKSDDGMIAVCMPGEAEENLLSKTALFGAYILHGGNIVYANSRMQQILGYGAEDIVGRRLTDFLHPDDVRAVKKIHADEGKGKTSLHYEAKFVTKSGETKYLDVMEMPVSHGGRNAIMGNVVDITERRKAEEALYSSERKYRQVVENAVEGIYRITMRGEFLEANSSFLEMFGYGSIDEISSENAWNMYANRGEVEEFLKAIKKRGKVRNYEMEGLRKGGGRIFTTQSAVLVGTDEGEVIEGIIQDVTARKKAEAEAEFYNSLLRHDLGNKTQIIMGYLDLLAKYDIPKKQREFLEKAYEAVRSGSDLIEKIRHLHQVGEETSTKAINLDKVVKKVADNYSTEAERRGMKITYKGDAKLKVKAGVLVDEVIANLVENAMNHSGGTEIKISGTEEGDFAGICIEDNGRGIPDEMKKDVFKKKFKGRGSRGSGLGLYLVRKIAEGYGGRVEVGDSESGGARFNVYFRKR